MSRLPVRLSEADVDAINARAFPARQALDAQLAHAVAAGAAVSTPDNSDVRGHMGSLRGWLMRFTGTDHAAGEAVDMWRLTGRRLAECVAYVRMPPGTVVAPGPAHPRRQAGPPRGTVAHALTVAAQDAEVADDVYARRWVRWSAGDPVLENVSSLDLAP